MAKKYGHEKMFGTYFLNTPILGIGDPELAKQILVKDFNHFVNRQGEAISSIFESELQLIYLMRLMKIQFLTVYNLSTVK